MWIWYYEIGLTLQDDCYFDMTMVNFYKWTPLHDTLYIYDTGLKWYILEHIELKEPNKYCYLFPKIMGISSEPIIACWLVQCRVSARPHSLYMSEAVLYIQLTTWDHMRDTTTT